MIIILNHTDSKDKGKVLELLSQPEISTRPTSPGLTQNLSINANKGRPKEILTTVLRLIIRRVIWLQVD